MEKVYNYLCVLLSSKKHQLCLMFCFFMVYYPANAQPGQGVISVDDSLQAGYVLFSPEKMDTTYLLYKPGNIIVYKWHCLNPPGMAVYLLPDGNLLRAEDIRYYNGSDTGCGYPGGLIAMYDRNSDTLWTYTINSATEQQTHDIYPILKNGHVLADVWEKIPYQEAINAGRSSNLLPVNTDIWSGKVVELAPPDAKHKNVREVWHWRFWNHLDSTGSSPYLLNVNDTGTPVGFPVDWIHMNAVTYNEALDQVMVSSRNLNEVYIIDHSTTIKQAKHGSGGKYGKGGNFLYRWGNPHAYGQKGPQQLFGQHSPYWIPAHYPYANKIMINNDGFDRCQGDTLCLTTVNIIDPRDSAGHYKMLHDSTYAPRKPSWTYPAPEPLWNPFEGGAQMLSSGNVLICSATKGIFYEINAAGDIVWEYKLSPQNPKAFRCTQYDSNYPGIKKLLNKK